MANEDRITGFEYVGATPLTEEQYSTQFVDFYRQFLGLPTLEQETGIETTDPEEITELRQPGRGREDGGRDTSMDIGDFGFKGPEVNTDLKSFSSPFGTYKDALNAAGLQDRVPFVENIVDPVMSGDISSIQFGKQAGVVLDEATAEVKGIAGLTSFEDLKKKVSEKIPSAMAGTVSMMDPLMGATVGGVLTGKTFVNAFGMPSMRPGGVLGAITDVVANMQYNDMAAINAATVSGAAQTGFAGLFGNLGITRAPGSGTYTGNMQGMSHVQVKNMEALSKGFAPNTYNMIEETGDTLQEAGYTTGRLATGGYYKENGTYMDQFGRTSAVGLMEDLESLASKYGVSVSQASNALSNARQGNGTLSQNLGNFRTPTVGMSRPSAVATSEDATVTTSTKYDVEGGTSPSFGPGPKVGPGPEFYADQAFNLFGLRDGIIVGGTGLYDYKAGTYPSTEISRLSNEGVPVSDINQSIRMYGDRSNEPAPQPSGDGGGDDNFRGSGMSRSDFGSAQESAKGYRGGYGFADGGRVGLAMGGAPQMASGFVERPPSQVSEDQSVADNVDTSLPEGAFVINAAAVEFAGEQDIKKMLLDANKEAVRRGLTVDKQGNGAKLIDVAISRGEVVVSPHLAKIIGYDRLNKINNRGKSETKERIAENGQQRRGAASGGFIDQEGPIEDTGEYKSMRMDIPQETMDLFRAYVSMKNPKRADVERLINSLDEQGAMALTILTETIASRDPLESMQAVGQVILNRANTNDPDFDDVNDIKAVLKQRTSRGKGSKMFQFDGLEPTSVKNRLREVVSGRAPEALDKVFAAAENVLSGQDPDAEYVSPIPDTVLYYTKPGAAGAGFFTDNPLLEEFNTIGGHNFYTKHRTPEFP